MGPPTLTEETISTQQLQARTPVESEGDPVNTPSLERGSLDKGCVTGCSVQQQ